LFSAATLFVLSIIIGFAYTFFSDKGTSPTSAINTPATPAVNYNIKPRTSDPNAPVGVAVESFSSLVYPGGQAYLAVKTNPGAVCVVAIMYYKTTPATDAGLGPQTADDFGTANWDWKVSPAAPTGFWPVNITCSHNKKSGVVQAQLDISQP